MRRVVKVGGSLLRRVELMTDLSQWLQIQSAAETLVVVGGGGLVDAIRELDAIRPCDTLETHWQCVDLLDVTSRILASWFSWPVVSDLEQLNDAIGRGFPLDSPTIVAVKAFYRRDADEPLHLPTDWRTTTDAIAASLALRVGADELVLLKSCAVDPTHSISKLAEEGVVDESTAPVAAKIPCVRVEQLPHAGASRSKG